MRNIVGERIRKLRKSLKLSQMELGEKVGVSLKTVYRWEKGEVTPNSQDLLALAKALNTTVGYLVGEVDDPYSPREVEEEKLKKQSEILLESEKDFNRLIRELARYNPDIVLRLRTAARHWSELSEADKKGLAQILFWALDVTTGRVRKPPGEKVEEEI